MKKILFLNTTKLAVLSAMLLLAVFCTIGMSFTPAEEGENIGNPNDSTYITGPRRSHWTTSGTCGSKSYHNEIDYAQVKAVVKIYGENNLEISSPNIARVTLENISTSTETGTVDGSSLSGDETTSAYINWNSSAGTNSDGKQEEDTKIAAAHKLQVRFTAECIHDDYNFVGWYKAEGMSDSDFKEGAASFSEVICIGGGISPGAGYGSYADADTKQKTYTQNDRYTVTYYACFQLKANVTVTLEAAKNGTYTYTDGTQSGTITSKEDSIKTTSVVTLQASPATGYKFFGWYEIKGGKETYFSYESSMEKTFPTDATICAKFIPDDAALFIIKDGDGTEYWNLNEACEKALSSSKVVVLPKDNGTLYPLVDGELCTNPEGKTITPHTIPSGVTLLVPYEKDANCYTEFTDNMLVHETWAKPKCFRKLTLGKGCIINVNGNLNVAASIYSVDGGKLGSGAPKVYGQIDMQSGSNITIKENAKLYCWGFITGAEGFVEIDSVGTVCESLQIQHHPGGSEALKWMGNKKALFLNQYYAQNIESPLRINTGAIEKVYATMYVYSIQKTNATFIGRTTDKDALFQLNGGYLIRKYDSQKDRIVYNFYGDFKFNYLSLRLASTIDIETTSYPLPVTNNMTVNCYPDPETNKAEMTFEYDVALLPGTEILIDKYVTANVSGSMFAYDIEAWKDKGYAGLSTNVTPVQFSPTCTYKRTIADLKDARVELNGTLNIKPGGLINTTTGSDDPTKYGADVCSSGGGVIKFETPSATEKTYQYKSNSLGTAIEIPVTSAQLHNDTTKNPKYHYTQTSGANANDVFEYDGELGRWRCERTITWDANGGTIEPTTTIVGRGEPLSLYFPESLPIPTREGYNFNGWFASGGTPITIDTVVNDSVTYHAQWTLNIVGTPLDIVDADNTKDSLTINTNGWASSGWPYTINGTPYEKGDRKADRTLVIPYSGQPNNDMPIELKDEEGTVVSCHIYKVPFVYTGNATMSGTDSTSIVFVKSGTLTVGTDSVKEIYVADSAELKVTGTLTVGKLVLRTTPYKAAILTIETNGSIALTDGGQVYYSRISPDAKQYYQFGLPLSCPLASVQMSNTGKLGGSQPKYGTAWMLKSYSESSRANNGISNEGANWSLLPSEGTITAGVGYEMFSNSNYYREFYFPVDLSAATTQVSVQYTGGTISAEHNGWNIITSPLTSKATVTIGDPATAIKVCWLNEDGSYRQEQPTVIPPAIPFSYQASAEGELNFAVPTIAAAPRKQSAAEALTETEWVHLDIFDAYGEGDETSLFVHPTRFEQTYKTGIDMAKQSLTASRPIIYSTHAYGDMAFAGVADSLLENGIDLVVYSPSAQELTFSLRENKFLNRLEYLWLADNETGARTDLLMNDYTFRADAGTAKGRFVLNGRFKAPQISTGIGNTQTDYNIYAIGNNIAISGVEQGTPIYVFDAVGHMIYTTAATSDEVIVPAPCAGVYMLSVGGQTAKLVINQ